MLQDTGFSAPEWFDSALHLISFAIEAVGVAVMVIGALIAAGMAAIGISRGGSGAAAYHQLRTNLGRSILLGLELLVAADIIGTVAIEPSVQNLFALGLIVLIRTFLSISLEVEIDGQWPWQKGGRKRETFRGRSAPTDADAPAGGDI